MSAQENSAALERLDELTRRLRRDCPWDREQDERSIVPHTLEEAYELADAAMRGDDSRLIDELGDVLFQVHFLSLLLEERGAGDMAQVADHCREKLIRRHPHVFGEVEVENAADVLGNWEKIKVGEEGREQGVFGEVPENLPGLLYARKLQRRSASSGFDPASLDDSLATLTACAQALEADTSKRGAVDARILGDLLFAAVNVARKAKVDPELALRGSANAFRSRVQFASDRAADDGRAWEDLEPEDRLRYYAQATFEQEPPEDQ